MAIGKLPMVLRRNSHADFLRHSTFVIPLKAALGGYAAAGGMVRGQRTAQAEIACAAGGDPG
jgi:hypothetical protein